ncbi:large subunit ribosomal protein L10 [Thiohalospira halophila DSM 15071]|uniref:Large ribosomal subunit protein uL10 n=1 Tax=Thiohalospira halophila DSM 15071 TaxID=1123397 RepID=A0A1I1WK14_9GAMM|nr:50S ribosomal protein L10 [Thiohalospira halophila]SFD95497.1 large subunit ribosomal protein L10 [Thiohalospira halophila DSM 15071]
MPLTLEEKKSVVAEVADVASSAHSAIAAEYRGLTAVEMTELRANARNEGVYLRVVKNTLAARAVAGTEFECIAESLSGPLLLAFSLEDPGAAARLLKDFGKKHENLSVQLVAVGGQVHPASELERLASLPNREQALSQLLAAMKAPVEKFVRTLNEPQAKLARTLGAVREQKEAQGA